MHSGIYFILYRLTNTRQYETYPLEGDEPMALLDLAEMRRKCQAGQWSLADIDWNAPGAEAVTPAQAERMKRFMADLVWIESFGQYAFEAMAAKTKDPDLRAIYESFAVDELRHADRSEEHTSELQSHSFISYAVF